MKRSFKIGKRDAQCGKNHAMGFLEQAAAFLSPLTSTQKYTNKLRDDAAYRAGHRNEGIRRRVKSRRTPK